jgi:hypothetical protein
VNTITSLFLKSTIEKCKQQSVEALKHLYVTAEFFEVSIASHEKAEPAIIAI